MRAAFATAARLIFAAVLVPALAIAQTLPQSAPLDPQALAGQIQQDIEALRGLSFVRDVTVNNQSIEEFAEYLEREIESFVPPDIALHYGDIVRKLGLYRGTADLEFSELMKGVMTSQVAAYYDPAENAFYVLSEGMPSALAGAVYAHELYHALQDQHFDLETYIRDGQREQSLSDDELLARQAVVEGEAMYVMLLWTLQNMLGTTPPRAMLAGAVAMQSQMNVDALMASMQQPGTAAILGEDFAARMEAADEIPAFILETLVGAYTKGLGFVFAVEERGWSEVEKLYAEYPPQSTEQILHPEKWFARETPARFEWPALASHELFEGFQVLEENVLGEVQWRIVFAEHGFRDEAESAAAGWDGDRWAVLKDQDSGELLLLIRTAWDTEGDAVEFASAYSRLLEVKYAERQVPTRIVRDGAEVLIVEGGREGSLDAYVDFLARARKSRAQ